MKKLTCAMVVVAGLWPEGVRAGFDYTYAVDWVMNVPPDPHLQVSQVGTVVTNESSSGPAYYQVSDPGPGTGELTGTITYHFQFDQPTGWAHLSAGMALFRWWYGYGSGSILASANGSDYHTLLSAGPPDHEGGALYPHFDGDLPPEVLGSGHLYIQCRLVNLKTYPIQSNPFRNTAQFQRGHPDALNTFELAVNFIPEPATALLVAMGLAAARRRRA